MNIKKIAAYQSAKALNLLKNDNQSVELLQATVLPLNGEIGNCSIVQKIEKNDFKKTDMLKLIDFHLSGRVAEELLFGKDEISNRSSSDLFKATKLAKKVVKYFDDEFMGIIGAEKTKELSDESRYKLEEAIIVILKEREQIVRGFIHNNKNRINQLADDLAKKEVLTKHDIMDRYMK